MWRLLRQGARKRFAGGAKGRVIRPGVNGTVSQCDDEPAALGEYWHTIQTDDGERREPGCNLDPVPAPIGTKASEHPGTETHLPATVTSMPLIAESRLGEFRKIVSAQFDFRKLVRLCEEINTVYGQGCYFATAMVTRGLLDHVPPLFGKKTFSEVASSYSGGGKSFADNMSHLQNSARKVADAFLHVPVRKSETLPTAQQVNFAPQLDALLAEILRITK